LKLRTIIIEDSPIYLRVLEEQVKQSQDLEIAGTASNFDNAVALLKEEPADLLLLDIEIGEATSFELLPYIHKETKIIFITSHEDYAVRAFEINALDYIVKPVTQERLQKAVEKLFSSAEGGHSEERMTIDQRVMVSAEDKYVLIALKDVDFLESLGNYVKIYASNKKTYVIYGSIKSWVNTLPAQHFFQIHRSYILNLDRIQRIEKWTNETGRAYITGREEPLEISRSNFARMKKIFRV
jgi:two-component system LytT family response regulator